MKTDNVIPAEAGIKDDILTTIICLKETALSSRRFREAEEERSPV
jgi:hypothetical protein